MSPTKSAAVSSPRRRRARTGRDLSSPYTPRAPPRCAGVNPAPLASVALTRLQVDPKLHGRGMPLPDWSLLLRTPAFEITACLLGLVVGSFANVCVHRL